MGRSSHVGHARRALAFAVALAVPALVACNALIGLDEFDKGQCPGARCDGGTGPDVIVTSDAGVDATVDSGRGADPVSWARWPMPNYDAGADAGLVNPLSYTVSGNEITDNVTKLVWRDDVVAGDFSFAAAAAACANLSGSWRLPKRIELVTLLDFGQPGGSVLVDPQFKFKNVKVWTSSEVRPYAGGPDQPYWTVSFDTGVVGPQKASLNAKALCVKAK